DLLKSYIDLRLKPDKSKLDDLINKVKEMDLSKYTNKTVGNLKAALNRASEVLDDEEATNSIVEKAVKDLELAVASLEEKKDNEGNSGNNNNNGDNNNQGNNGNNGNNNSGNNKPNKDNGKGGELPSTGAAVSSTVMLLLGAGAVIAGAKTLKKRKREE
ncbi:LPXTG cell wall anchor domain-containing protein, partial [Clostridium perfringens]